MIDITKNNKLSSQLDHRIVVVKYGGNAMTDDDLKLSFAQDIALLKNMGIKPVIVHGGGPQINALLNQLNIPSVFFHGLRVTDKETMAVVEMVLSGSVNKQIVSLINQTQQTAIGINGMDGHCIQVKKISISEYDNPDNIDIGLVGEITAINTDFLLKLIDLDFIPVIAPIGVGSDGLAYNINADIAAGQIANALHASKFLMLTNISGVLNGSGELMTELSAPLIAELIKTGVLTAGMIPKINVALEVAEKSNNPVQIIDGRIPHILLETIIEQKKLGTTIFPTPKE